MICLDCLGKKGKWVGGLIKCDFFGMHVVPGTETWEFCPTCKGTGEVPDEIVAETGKTPIHFDNGPPAIF